MTRDPFRLEPPFVVSVSGGRTSAYLLRRVLTAWDGRLPAGGHAVFANTGKEFGATLDFVRDLTTHWGVAVRWVEYDFTLYPSALDAGACVRPKWREVTHATACRDGEPFERMIRRERYVPNAVARTCTKNLKIKTMQAFAADALGLREYTEALGLRHDEPTRTAKARARIDKGEDLALPLDDARTTRAEVMAFWAAQPFDLKLQPHESNCDACLAGETEVVTADGIRPIRELAGTTPELLVPIKGNAGSTSELGHFVAAPVRSFGVQRLWKIVLQGHGRAEKTVYATAEHRWFIARAPGGRLEEAIPTSALRPGHKLRNLFRYPIGQERGGASRIAAMRGFVFGDGATQQGERPGTLDIYGTKEVFVPLFTACCGEPTQSHNDNGTPFWHFYGIPDYWKRELPSLRESRHYLMGWLAGWFAADGCVSEAGNCILASARAEHLEFARSVCAILGVQCTRVRSYEQTVRLPHGSTFDRSISAINLNRHHLTADFFWLPHHAERVAANGTKQARRYGWTVASVEPTDRVEEVFCATVEDVGAFGLADGLMTGNCFLKSQKTRMQIMRDHPGVEDWWIGIERDRGQTFRSSKRADYAELSRRAHLPVVQPVPHATQPADADDDAILDCACTD